MEIKIIKSCYLKWAFMIFLFLALVHFIAIAFEAKTVSKIPKFFSLRHEMNLPTFISSLNITLAGVFAFLNSLLSLGRRKKRFWALVSILLLIMGYDEAAGLHEYYGSVYGSDILNNFFGLSAIWVNSFIPIIVIISIAMAIEMSKLKDRYIYNIVPPAIFFLIGAVGVELITFELFMESGILRLALESLEELIEILAIIWLNSVLLEMLEEKGGVIRFSESSDPND